MSIADYLVDKMLQKNIVVDDKEIYIYGLNNGIMILINFMTTFFLSFMMQKTFILLFFLVSLYHYVHTVEEYIVNLAFFAIYFPMLLFYSY